MLKNLFPSKNLLSEGRGLISHRDSPARRIRSVTTSHIARRSSLWSTLFQTTFRVGVFFLDQPLPDCIARECSLGSNPFQTTLQRGDFLRGPLSRPTQSRPHCAGVLSLAKPFPNHNCEKSLYLDFQISLRHLLTGLTASSTDCV